MQAEPPILHLVRIENHSYKTRLRAGPAHGGHVKQTTTKGDGDLFRIVKLEPHKYGIRTQYVSYVRGNIDKTVDHVGHLQTWETWEVEQKENGLYVFKSYHNTYLTFHPDTNTVFLDVKPSPDAEFELNVIEESSQGEKHEEKKSEEGKNIMQVEPPILHLVRIENHSYKTLLKADPTHGVHVKQTTTKGDGDLFRIIKLEPHKYGIRTQHVSYVRGNIDNTVDHVGHLQIWETWEIEQKENGLYVFKSYHNTYLTFGPDKNTVFLDVKPSPDAEFELNVIEESSQMEKHDEMKHEEKKNTSACCKMF